MHMGSDHSSSHYVPCSWLEQSSVIGNFHQLPRTTHLLISMCHAMKDQSCKWRMSTHVEQYLLLTFNQYKLNYKDWNLIFLSSLAILYSVFFASLSNLCFLFLYIFWKVCITFEFLSSAFSKMFTYSLGSRPLSFLQCLLNLYNWVNLFVPPSMVCGSPT